MKTKKGVHQVTILSTPYMLCNKCSSRVFNLLSLYRKARSDSYKSSLIYLMFHAVGFNH